MEERDRARAEALGWMHAECCASLDRGVDPRQVSTPEMVERAQRDLAAAQDTGDDWPGHISPTAQQVECPTDDHSARCYLRRAEAEMADRAASRDAPDGERSMGRAVDAFCALYGDAIRARVDEGRAPLDETMGWQFMSILKKARGAAGAYREDDYTDDVAYAALAAESAAKEVG